MPAIDPDRVFQRRPRIRPARAQRGEQAEDDAREEGERHAEREDAAVGTRADQKRRPLDRNQGQQGPRQHDGEGEAGEAAEERQQQALDEQLLHEAPARRAERQAQRDLLLPHEASRDEQIRDVGARDEQHEADHAHQHDEGGRELVSKGRVAHRGALHEQLALQEPISAELRPLLRGRQRRLVRANLREQAL